MKVIKDLSKEIRGTNTHFFRLDELSEDDGVSVLLYGYNMLKNDIVKTLDEYKRVVYFSVTMPTEYCGDDVTLQDHVFDEVYSICPYSTKWLNGLTNSNKYKTIFYPFNKDDIPDIQEKEYDVCYHGGIHGSLFLECIKIISKFNYRYMSMTRRINKMTRRNLHFATNINMTHRDKLRLVGKCKISVCYNVVALNQHHASNIKNRERWFGNEGFSHVDDLGIVPQLKSRLNEAAFSRTLNLVYRDPWNVAELYYEPGVDFIYFNSNDVLEEKIRHILDNWGDYQQIIENAYQKSMNYTTNRLYNIIKNDYEV